MRTTRPNRTAMQRLWWSMEIIALASLPRRTLLLVARSYMITCIVALHTNRICHNGGMIANLPSRRARNDNLILQVLHFGDAIAIIIMRYACKAFLFACNGLNWSLLLCNFYVVQLYAWLSSLQFPILLSNYQSLHVLSTLQYNKYHSRPLAWVLV